MFRIIIPLTTGSMIKVGGQSEHASATHADMQAVTIRLDADKLAALLDYCAEPRTREEMQDYCGIKTREYFRKKILVPMIQQEKVLLTIPDKPKSPKQKYYTKN